MSHQLAVVLATCDGYSDLWEPFFQCLERFSDAVPDCTVYVNTEHQRITRNGALKIKTVNQTTQRKISWSKRMLSALEQIEEPFLLLLLDDFFACDRIRWDLIEKAVVKLQQNPDVASVQFYGTRIRNADPEHYMVTDEPQYRVMDRQGWKTHFVPTVWRKDVLIKWLRPWETIWAFESCGSARARRWNYPEKVLIVDSPPVYDYLWIKDCSAVINSKWLNEPELFQFFEENGIAVDFSKRGKMSRKEYEDITMKDVLKRYTPWQIVVKSFNRFRSLF